MKIEVIGNNIFINGDEWVKKESTQPTPKDGEIWYVKVKSYNQYIFTYKSGCGGSTRKYFGYSIEGNNLYLDFNLVCYDHEIELLLPATPEETALLHSKLAEKGKVWNAEKKQLEDLPKPLKEDDLAIFWDDEKRFAVIGEYLKSMGESTFTFFKHLRLGGVQYVNAIPFESVEQYEQFRKS